ncbi:MAG: universal stress protein [Spirochaetaceae bacterium]|nr:universal stress protein [Spirochaetaceae bacterium]
MYSNNGKLMVYLDGSEEAYIALLHAIYLAKRYSSTLYGISNVNTMALEELVKAGILLESERQEYQSNINDDADRHLAQFTELSKLKNISSMAIKVKGNASLNINAAVIKHQVELLVVGELKYHKSAYNEVEHIIKLVPCSTIIAKDSERIKKFFYAV